MPPTQNKIVQKWSNLEDRCALIYMMDAECAETNEKSNFRFLFFELWLIAFTIYGDTPGVPPTKKKVVQKWPNLQERYALI